MHPTSLTPPSLADGALLLRFGRAIHRLGVKYRLRPGQRAAVCADQHAAHEVRVAGLQVADVLAVEGVVVV